MLFRSQGKQLFARHGLAVPSGEVADTPEQQQKKLNITQRIARMSVAEKIKLDLHLSDTQLGMMTGLAFAIFYTLLGIPIAILADRANRPWIITRACVSNAQLLV